jgi:hypothetical protein
LGFLNQAGETVKEAAEGRQSTAGEGNAVENMTGFSKTKRDLAIKLGVDPYTTNEVFQEELNKVAWPAFLGTFTVDLGMAAVGGAALSAANLDQHADRRVTRQKCSARNGLRSSTTRRSSPGEGLTVSAPVSTGESRGT